MIQLVKLRQWTPKGEKEPKTFHKFFDPPITAESVHDLFADAQFYVDQIPVEDRWNVYFTACKAVLGTRNFIEQDIIPFDIDNIDVDQKEKYIDPICSVLGIDQSEVGITFSGNGLQIIVGLKEPFKDKSFFEKHKIYYKAICEKIDDKLAEFGLLGKADPSVFSTARILRLPETLNKKPNKPERKAFTLRKNILANGFDIIQVSGIPILNKEEFISDAEFKRFPTPDTKSILEGCSFIKNLKDNKYTEPEWYAALSILGRLPDGYSIAKEYSQSHPKYNETRFDSKFNQAMTASGPRTCSNINNIWGKCGSCPNFQKVKTPLRIVSSEFIPEKIGNKITESFVVQKLIENYGENIVKKNGDLFFYKDGVWKHINDDKISLMKLKIMNLFGSNAKSKDVESAFKSFSYNIKISPVEMFEPNPYCVNFTNGTLHIFKKDDQSWDKIFKPHSKEDYLINQLPYEYLPDNREQNSHFLEMIDRVFADDEDKIEKVLAIKQMYGACLIPAFPHLFMLHGKTGTGKTSVILPLYEFLKNDNICSVEPFQLSGFAMESMAGKLVNIVTDIDTKKPIEDANIKKIEDRLPFRISRKFKTDIYSPLPAIHVFGANSLPPTLEGDSRAHSRRWSFIEFKSFQASGFYDKSFSAWVFKQNPRGVLNFALEGLDDLLMSRGHFINPASGKEKLNEWMVDGDIVAQFLADIESNEIKEIEFKEYGKIERSEFYEIFTAWTEEAGHKKYHSNVMSRNQFYRALRAKNLPEHKNDSARYFASYQKRI